MVSLVAYLLYNTLMADRSPFAHKEANSASVMSSIDFKISSIYIAKEVIIRPKNNFFLIFEDVFNVFLTITKQKVMSRLSYIFILVLVIASCNKISFEDEAIPVDSLIPRRDIVLTKSQSAIIQKNNSFAIELFKQISSDETDKSMVISPLSISYALGMLVNGASGDTRAEIDSVLGYGEESLEELNSFYRTMIDSSSEIDPSTDYEIGNMLLVNNRYIPLKEEYASKMKTIFDANICYKDFLQEDIKGIINTWCSDKTKGKIPVMISDPIDPDQYLHILNATYFKGIWSSRFKRGDSKKDLFSCENGSLVTVNMMHQKGEFNYWENSICNALVLPYGNQAFNMFILLPNQGTALKDLRGALCSEFWGRLVQGKGGREVDVKIPSFEAGFSADIADYLSNMGIKKAFSERADLSLISNLSVYVSKALHKTRIVVNEEGSEAAAVTDLYICNIGIGDYQPVTIDFHADHPFIYAITEVSTGAILFIGQFTGKE